MEKKAAGTEENRQKEQQGAGQREKDQDSGRMEVEKKTWDGQQDKEELEYGQGAGQRNIVRNGGTESKTEW